MSIVKCESQYCDDVECLAIRKEEARKAFHEAQKAYADAIRAHYAAKAEEEIRSTIA